jgi:hypothetical protein
MHDPRSASDRDAVARRVLAVAVALSLLIHGAALWEWLPDLGPLAFDIGQAPKKDAPLTAKLATKPRDPESDTAPSASPAPPPAPRPAATPSPKSRPPVLLAERTPAPPMISPELPTAPVPTPVPQLAPPPVTPIPPPPAITPPVTQVHPDLSSYIAAQRRARGESESGPSSPEEDENARVNRIVAANLASVNAPTFGAEKRNTGGMFQITQLSTDSAEFTFFGWNRDIKRRASQRIDVRRGPNGDIRIAVVRKMIAIIREYEQEDFTWRSNRLARDVTLSARAADNEGLEQFMMREFF